MTGDGRTKGQSHSIIWGVFFCLLLFSFKIQNFINIWKHWIFSAYSLEVRKWEGKVCTHFTTILLFILGKMSDVQNTSEGFVHKPHVDNYAALQLDECIWEMPSFRENISGLGFLQDEWDQTKGFLKWTSLVIWVQSPSQWKQAGRAQIGIGCCQQSTPARIWSDVHLSCAIFHGSFAESVTLLLSQKMN